ncbi:MAG: iron-containing alcohol dehydrogenase [Halanaerobiales bacterium]
MLNIYDIKTFEVPTKLVSGVGSLKKLTELMLEQEISSPLIVTDKGIREAGILEKVEKILVENDYDYHIYDQVTANPDVETVDKGYEVFSNKNCDGLIALGGGSSIDTAKGIGVLTKHGGSIIEYEFGKKPLTKRITPLIAIPTTAGTGSEGTMWAVITDHQRQVKYNVGGPLLAPQIALVDPKLHLSLPPNLTAGTGMDALCHAIECYTSHFAQPLTDSVALLAIEYSAKYLRRAVANGEDLEARYYMAQAATLAGFSYGSESAGAVHAMTQTLGGIKPEIPHGEAVGTLLGPVMLFNWMGEPEKFKRIATALGKNVRGLSTRDGALAAVDAVFELADDIGIPTLQELGVKEEEIPKLAAAAEDDPQTIGNPRDINCECYEEIYRYTFELAE